MGRRQGRQHRQQRQHRQGRNRRITGQKRDNRQQKKKYRFIIKQGTKGVKRRLIVEIGMDKKKNLLVTIWDSRNNKPSIRLYEHEMNNLVELYQNLITKVREEMLPDYDFAEYKQHEAEDQYDVDLLDVSNESDINQLTSQEEETQESTEIVEQEETTSGESLESAENKSADSETSKEA